MSSDSEIYIKTIETDSELGAFEITGTGATSLITPNPTKSGYSPTQTSFVVGSDQLDDYSSTTDKDTRMLFDKIKGAFRAGTVVSTQWDSASRGTNSAALGLNNIASGANSFAAGTGNTASGSGTVAIGATNSASASNAVAIGNNNTSTAANTFTGGNACNATQSNAVAIGQYCKASGQNSTSIGYGTSSDEPAANTASGTGSIAIGNSNTASAANAVAIGEHNISAGSKSFTFGTANNCNIDATGSIAIGNGVLDSQLDNNNNVCGQYSISIGRNNNIGSTLESTKRYTDNSIVIGTSNTLTGLTGTPSNNSIILGSNCTVTNANYATAIGQYCKATGANSFAIGHGSSGAENTASGNGSFVIGFECVASTSNSICMGYKAEIDTTVNIGGPPDNTFFWNGDTNKGRYANYPGSACFRMGTNGEFKLQKSAGSITGGYGNVTSEQIYTVWTGLTNGWTNTSDINKKENLIEQNYTDILDKIMKMPVYTYNYKTVDPSIKCFGPVAQDFNRLFVSNVDQLMINSGNLAGITLSGIKGVKLGLDNLSSDVNTRFDDLSENVDSRFASNSETTSALQSRIAVLEAKIAAIENRLAT